MITFKEYMKYNNKTQINAREARVLGIVDRSSGWLKRYADNIVTQEMIDKLGSRKKRGMKAIRESVNVDYKVSKIDNVDGKHLYLMQNPIGMLKVGVSQDPVKRAKQITGACGMLMKILGVWSFDKRSTIVESMVMESLSEHRLHGEWFREGSVCPAYVSRFLGSKGIDFVFQAH